MIIKAKKKKELMKILKIKIFILILDKQIII